jgi:hypothetical protein
MIIIRTETTGEYEFMDRLCRNMANVRVYAPNDYPCRTCKQGQEEKPKRKRIIKKRFYILLPVIIIAALLILIGVILFIIHYWPDNLFTSYYWRGYY